MTKVHSVPRCENQYSRLNVAGPKKQIGQQTSRICPGAGLSDLTTPVRVRLRGCYRDSVVRGRPRRRFRRP